MLAEAGEGESILYANLDPAEICELRQSIPTQRQKRTDLYQPPRQI